MYPVRLVFEPTVIPLAEMAIIPEGLDQLYDWVADNRPECMPEGAPIAGEGRGWTLFPRDDTSQSGNELLAELAGRTCYMSFAEKAGRKNNAEYLAHTQAGPNPHRSILYHTKMSFFIAGVSRSLSHELIRHYVGSDRDEEGSPSQESSRYTEHPGTFVVPPQDLGNPEAVRRFRENMEHAYTEYRGYLNRSLTAYQKEHGVMAKGLARKQIYEAAAMQLPQACSTSYVWTTNPIALRNMFRERLPTEANREIRRLCEMWQTKTERWPGLFPQTH